MWLYFLLNQKKEERTSFVRSSFFNISCDQSLLFQSNICFCISQIFSTGISITIGASKEVQRFLEVICKTSFEILCTSKWIDIFQVALHDASLQGKETQLSSWNSHSIVCLHSHWKKSFQLISVNQYFSSMSLGFSRFRTGVVLLTRILFPDFSVIPNSERIPCPIWAHLWASISLSLRKFSMVLLSIHETFVICFRKKSSLTPENSTGNHHWFITSKTFWGRFPIGSFHVAVQRIQARNCLLSNFIKI